MNTARFALLAFVTAGAAAVAQRHVRAKLDAAEQERENLRSATSLLKHRNEQLSALYNIFSEITGTLSLHSVVNATLQECLQLMDAQGAVLWLIRDGVLMPVGGLTDAGQTIRGLMPRKLGDGLTGYVAKVGVTVRIDDHNLDLLLPAQRSMGVRSGVSAPLIVGARVVGVLNCWSVENNRFDDEDQRILEMMASQVATAVVAADAMEQSERKAHHDALTGLPNRHQLNADLEGELAAVAMTSRSAVVAMIDIDHFKAFNDEHGHRVGDVTLQRVASVLRTTVRDKDRLYRYGGEEFVLVFMDAGTKEAVDLSERIRRAVASTPFSGDHLQPIGPVTLSIGLVVLGEAATNFLTLIEMADGAMYEAKEKGRNQIVVWQADERVTRAA